MKKYLILMGDIINSRKYNAKNLNKNLNSIILESNLKYNNFILSKLEITIGDEFQCVMKDISSLLELMYHIDISLSYLKIKCRFAIGYGTVNGNINNLSAYNMLGTGLTYTHELLNNKNNKNKYRFFIQDDIIMEISLNTIGLLLDDIQSNITMKQTEYLYLKIVKDYSYEQIELKMNIKKRNIYRYNHKSKNILIHKIFTQICLLFNIENDKLREEYYKIHNIPNSIIKDIYES